MKKLIASALCLLMLIGTNGVAGVKAEELQTTYTGDAEENTSEDNALSEFNKEKITVMNYYLNNMENHKDFSPEFNNTYNDYKNYPVLYQQGTGINTLNDLNFEFMVNDEKVIDFKIGETKVLDSGYTITSMVKYNPANDKEFIKTAQDFTIIVEITLTNKIGESVTVEKSVNAKVVKVVGKIINRKAYTHIEKSFQYENINITDYLHGLQTNLKVRLLDGTIIDVVGFDGQGGGAGNDILFGMGLSSIYDFKYLLEDSTNPWSLETFILGYFVDKDNNLVNPNGNIVLPFEKREVKEYNTTNAEIKLNAKIGTLPDSATLESKVRTDLNLDKQYLAYDMNVICNGEYIQPAGSVDLSITLPETLLNKKLGIYYLNEQGELEELDSIVNGNTISFNTSHFSTYVVMEKDNSTTPITPDTSSKDTATDDTIKNTGNGVTGDTIKNTSNVVTGDTTMPIVFFSLLIVSGGMLIVLNKKRAFNKK